MSDTDTVTTTERWTYLGRRYWPGTGLVNVWERADGTEGAFKKFSGSVIGGIFEVEVVGDSQVRGGTPKFTFDRADAERCALLQALDRAAFEAKATADAEKRLSKSTELDRALAPLEALAAKCRTIAELEALQGVVRSRIAKAKWGAGS